MKFGMIDRSGLGRLLEAPLKPRQFDIVLTIMDSQADFNGSIEAKTTYRR
jgi:hypothetical protein